MNMKKVLAAGIAATLAVTSLAAVVSANEVTDTSYTWDMDYCVGKITYSPTESKSVDVKPIEPEFAFKKLAYKDDAHPERADHDYGVRDVTEKDYKGVAGVDYTCFDAFIPFVITTNAGTLADNNGTKIVDAGGNITVTIRGLKYDNGNTKEVVRTVTLQKADTTKITSIGGKSTAAYKDTLYILPIYAGLTEYTAFDPGEYNNIEEIKIDASGAKELVEQTLSESLYNYITTDKTKTLGVKFKDAKPVTLTGEAGAEAAYTSIKLFNEVANVDALTRGDFYYMNYNNGVCVKGDGEVKTGETNYAKELFAKFTEVFGTGVTINWKASAKELSVKYAWLPMTTDGDYTTQAGRVIDRWEVWQLSDTRDYNSDGRLIGVGAYTGEFDFRQSFDAVDEKEAFYTAREGLGNRPLGFSGMASQVADFFNKAVDGSITFKFSPAAPQETVTTWFTHGIPSTEIGLKRIFEDGDTTGIALFFNYNATTGSLQSNTSIDIYNNTVTFDITDILDALNGQTIGTVQDIYYCLNRGINYHAQDAYYPANPALLVQQVIFEKNKTANAETDAEEETEGEGEEIEDEPEDVDEEPADTEDEPEDIDDEPEDIDDEPEDIDDEPADVDDEPADVDDEPADVEEPDATVDDEPTTPVVVEEPTDGNQTPVVVAGEDENPGTGVALAVVPMLVAAAAAVVSKKRK